MILVVVGLQGSGKEVTANILKESGFHIIELGDIWRELIDRAGIPRTDVKATREFTMQLRVEKGKDIYARYALERIRPGMKDVAIMGVRSTYELDHLRGNVTGMKLLAIRAPVKLRFERMMKRAKPEDPKTIEEFRWLETRIKRGYMSDKKEEQYGLGAVMKLADYTVLNTGTIDELRVKINRILSKIRRGA